MTARRLGFLVPPGNPTTEWKRWGDVAKAAAISAD
jgi:hypothetical protein